MQTTNEILKALAPEFVALDELYNKWKSNEVNAREQSRLFSLMDTQTRALLDAYAQALAKLAEQEWQPIETAPKDGRTIIGWSKYMSEPCTIRWGKREGWVSSWEGDEVVESMCDFGTDYKDPNPVTHWLSMPLPPQEGE